MIYTPEAVRKGEGFGADKQAAKAAYEAYSQAVLRVLVRVKSPKVLRLVNDEGLKLKVGAKKQTWDHLLLFESDLIAAEPLKSSYRTEQYQEWLGKYKVGKWTLADIDNALFGNSLFYDSKSQIEQRKSEVFEGSSMDPRIDVRIKT